MDAPDARLIVIVDVCAIVDIIQRWVIAIRNKFNYQIDCQLIIDLLSFRHYQLK